MRKAALSISSKGPDPYRPAESRNTDSRFLRLWIVVTLIWTGATVLRVRRVWVPRLGLDNVLRDPLLWIAIAIPPVAFGVIVLSVYYLAPSRRRDRNPSNANKRE